MEGDDDIVDPASGNTEARRRLSCLAELEFGIDIDCFPAGFLCLLNAVIHKQLPCLMRVGRIGFILCTMRETILNAGTASVFLERLGAHIDHNINIMNRDGVIIASLDSNRTGSFHEAARRLVENGAMIERIEPCQQLPAGVQPGVNLPVVHEGEIIGVVGITGNPDEVIALAYAVKTSLESMIELDVWKEKALRRQDSRNMLMNQLLYEAEAPRHVMEVLARRLGYDPGLVRAPVLLVPILEADPAELFQAIRNSPGHGSEDMAFMTPDGYIIVFKVVRLGNNGILTSYEQQLREYVDNVESCFRQSRARDEMPTLFILQAYAGTPQTDIKRYGNAYRQTVWLSEYCRRSGSGIVFLFDHLLDYLSSHIPAEELATALATIHDLFPQELIRELSPLIRAFSESALNAKEAAARLGVHRNTFTHRLERISLLLGRDPRHDHHALEYLRLMVQFAELQFEGQKQVSMRYPEPAAGLNSVDHVLETSSPVHRAQT